MATTKDMTRGRRKGILVAPLSFTGERFTRADLVFTGVDHAEGSYEVLVFLNNKSATDATAHDIEQLGETVRARVKATSGIELQWEIKRIGIERK